MTWNTSGRNPPCTDGDRARGQEQELGKTELTKTVSEDGQKAQTNVSSLQERASGIFGGLMDSVSSQAGGLVGAVTDPAGILSPRAFVGPKGLAAGGSRAAAWGSQPSVVTWCALAGGAAGGTGNQVQVRGALGR